MNSNVLAHYIGGTLRNQIQTQVLASATETEFQVNTDTSIAGGATSIAVLALPLQTAIVGSGNPQSPSGNYAELGKGGRFNTSDPTRGTSRPYFSGAQFDSARPFLVRLTGVATPVSNAANSLALSIYSGTSKSGTKIATTGTNTGTETSTAASAFIIETQLFWDAVGQTLCGQQWYSVNSGTPLYNTWKTNTATASVTAIANMSFVATATWGNAVGGTISIGEFSITQL